MSRNDWLWFLRPTLGVILCYAIAMGMSYTLSQRNVDELDREMSVVTELASALGEYHRPIPQLSPREVVEIQASALGDPDQKRGALRCMCFASPDNLSVTGPLDRFAAMVHGPRFAALSAPDALIVGETVYQGDNARVLVTAILNDKVSAYVWVLAKQADGTYEDCWLTDGVFPMKSSDLMSDNEI